MSEFTIGRSPDSNLQISDPHVSRHHAKLVQNGCTLEVVDMGSSCGTFVNGQRVNHSTVRVGDDLRISQHHRFNWNLELGGVQRVVLREQCIFSSHSFRWNSSHWTLVGVRHQVE